MSNTITTYEILNFQELFKQTKTIGLYFAKSSGLSNSVVYRLINGSAKRLNQDNFNKLKKYYGDDLKYNEHIRHFKERKGGRGVDKEELTKKLAMIRAKQGRNPDGSLIGTKSSRLQEIEEEVKRENEKTDRIALLYKKQGIDLKKIN